MSNPQNTKTKIDTSALNRAIIKSAAVILKYQQPSGAYPASPNLDVYKYSWFRDGAFIAGGMSRSGHIESAERFFEWCAGLINDRREHILNGGKLVACYTYDGKDSQADWEHFQLDGYGTLLWVMKEHEARHGRSIEKYKEATGLIQHYLATHWQENCFDWWEERKGRHAATLSCIYAGLKAFEHPEAEAVKAAIDLSQERTDSSLLICALLGGMDTDAFAPMLHRIESELISENGGVYRYHDDTYYGGGEWPVLTGMLGWYYAKLGRTEDAEHAFKWIMQHMQDNGWLAEQSQDLMLHADQYQPWVERWGRPADPLLWSQAMLLTLASELRH